MMSILKAEYPTKSMQVIQVRHGDLTQEDTDVIVNAANSRLAHGGGVAGAIVRRGGRVIIDQATVSILQAELQKLGGKEEK